MRDRLHAGRQADERPLHTGGGGTPGLVRRVEHDGRARLGRAAQLVLRLVVAVKENPLAVDARRLRDGELAERRDVGADALLGEDPEQRDVRERLRPVDDECVRRGGSVRARLRADRLLAVDDERRPVLGRELRRGHAAERQLAALDTGRMWE